MNSSVRERDIKAKHCGGKVLMKCAVPSTLQHSSEKASPQRIIFDHMALLSISNRNPTFKKEKRV